MSAVLIRMSWAGVTLNLPAKVRGPDHAYASSYQV